MADRIATARASDAAAHYCTTDVLLVVALICSFGDEASTRSETCAERDASKWKLRASCVAARISHLAAIAAAIGLTCVYLPLIATVARDTLAVAAAAALDEPRRPRVLDTFQRLC